MFQYKIFSDMPNVFGITDDILDIGYDENGADHDNHTEVDQRGHTSWEMGSLL